MDFMPAPCCSMQTDFRRGVYVWQFEEGGAEFNFQQEQDEQEQPDRAELVAALQMQSEAGEELECSQ